MNSSLAFFSICFFHWFNRVSPVLAGDLLDRLEATDRIHDNLSLYLGVVNSALTHFWELRPGAMHRLRG